MGIGIGRHLGKNAWIENFPVQRDLAHCNHTCENGKYRHSVFIWPMVGTLAPDKHAPLEAIIVFRSPQGAAGNV